MIRFVVTILREVCLGSWTKPRAVMGSSDSKMVRCLGARPTDISPLRRRTVPFAKPMAICERLSSAANAEIYVSSKNDGELPGKVAIQYEC